MSQGFISGIPIDTDGTLSANSDFLVPSQKAVKTYVDTQDATKLDNSMNTNKLLGRGTAGVGAVEEITLGTNLSLTGTTLNAAAGGTVYEFMSFSVYQHNPADATTYYIGHNAFVPQSFSPAKRAIYPQKACTMVEAHVIWNAMSVAGSNENISIYIRVNDTTDTLIATVGDTNFSKTFYNNALSIAFNGTTDWFCYKIVYPTWAANPTTIGYGGTVKFSIP